MNAMIIANYLKNKSIITFFYFISLLYFGPCAFCLVLRVSCLVSRIKVIRLVQISPTKQFLYYKFFRKLCKTNLSVRGC